MKTLLLCLALFALPCLAQQPGSTYATVPDITGTAATVPLSATHTYCTQVQITALVANASVVRYGGSSTSISQGSLIAAGAGQTEVWDKPKPLDLANIFVYIATGDKVAVTCKQ